MRGFQNNQGTFFHCSEIGERNWVLKLVSSGDVGPAARNVTKNPSQRLDTGIIPTPWWFTPECEQQLLAIGDDGRLPSSSGVTEKDEDPIVAQLNDDQLKTKLITQLEYYFSRENLNQDRYLRSQMDPDQYVPIKVVASFPKISQLTSDLDLIVQVLKESKNVQVDETNTKVRAAHRRTTLLLREIPEYTDEREVKAMFIGCPKYISLSYGLNNSWYVTFETEEATQLAFLHLQNLRKSFNGKQICVRIKTGPAPLQDTGDHGRFSPTKSDTGNSVWTVTTSTGTITGIPSNVSLIVSPSTKVTNSSGQELSLDQLMGPFGYTVKAIFQPKNPEPPGLNVEKVTLPEIPLDTGSESGAKVLGPPSTEIVGSLLSAAAEANETKRREKENQMLQYQQIMESLAVSNGNSSPRIADTPFIMRPPALKRFISQESTDLEVALDIQRNARNDQKQPKERNQDHRYKNQSYSKKESNYSNYNGVAYDRGNFHSNGSERRQNFQNNFQERPRRSFEPISKDIRLEQKNPRQSNENFRSRNQNSSNFHSRNQGSREEKPQRFNERRSTRNSERYSSSSGSSYHQNFPQEFHEQHYVFQQQQPLKTIVERKQENYGNSRQNPNFHNQVPVRTPLLAVPQTSAVVSTVSQKSEDSTRKKVNSESSEYNFVDGDFPSLVEKEKIQKEKIKEKAKFSAVVAGKKSEEEVKKSYAQTLKKSSTSESN
ncbi:hypothetical protein FO519_001878 [Halicephalobus sp. NKZ332]|nr:hypothetical protein FO519_001878 [Halicephalobus sp. NKZ332]